MFSFILLSIGILIFILPEVIHFTSDSRLHISTAFELAGIAISGIAVFLALN